MSQDLREKPAVELASGPASVAVAEPPLIAQEREILHDLARLSDERARAEAETASALQSRTQAADNELRASLQRIQQQHDADTQAANQALHETRQAIATRFNAETTKAQADLHEALKKIKRQADSGKQAAQQKFESARWEAGTIFEATDSGSKAKYKALQEELELRVQELLTLQERTDLALAQRKQTRRLAGKAEPPSPDVTEGDPIPKLAETIIQADAALTTLEQRIVPRMFKGIGPAWLFVLLGIAFGLLSGFVATGTVRIVLASVATVAVGVGLWVWLFAVACRRVERDYRPLSRLLADAEALLAHGRTVSEAQFQRQQAEIRERRDTSVRQAEEKRQATVAELERRREADTRQAEATAKRLREEAEQRRDRDTRLLEENDARRREEIRRRFETETHQAKDRHQEFRDLARRRHQEQWDALASRWHEGMTRTRAAIRHVHDTCRQLFAAWEDPSWRPDAWTPPQAVPPALRFGEFAVDAAQIPHSTPTDPRLHADAPTDFTLPALVAFPERCSVLLKASDEGRTVAVQALQALMLRLLTAVPPGKVRFTILDPVGLGESFAAFMHLADIDDALITGRIWTEPQQIDQRLVDMTEHMENVIQKYLRHEFETIEEYNAMAGEVAEPFRFLVVANFPANFSDTAARRLLSIAASGPRCGVHTLISVDTQMRLPHGFDVKDLERYSLNLTWKAPRFHWRDPDFGPYRLTLDAPPPSETFIDTLQAAGTRAKEAKRVEVPFDYIAPAPDKWWTNDSRAGVDVPLGRAGATKLQHLTLGRGTSQHVLVAGKTGSGKSTLMHALITNLALHYSPEEIELYLIDFKKGVEFKTYAAHELAHARVIAVESEREFGLSVLQRLDVELKLRGDRFRDVGAQDLRAFRQATGKPTPRILLIVDEFQEFFIEDDKIAQDASLLLDRLVRQGRAFGIHVLLGSQTLGGAYSLARSTVGQMAVRIALQCSEADAHLILSEENSAARLLSRPGEAIYNDANGLVDGNHPFQVVWLDDQRREAYLKDLHRLAVERNLIPSVPAIVFEGNLPADLTKNPFLTPLLEAPDWPAAAKAFHAWLGEAIAIKDPTEAVFRPQSGNNVLIVGQNEEAARGILATALISLAAQHPPGQARNQTPAGRFVILDGTQADSPFAGFFEGLAGSVPHEWRVASPRELAATIGELAEELDRRQKAFDPEAPSIYAVVFDLQRFRELRKGEDDFGFGRRGEEKANPAKQFVGLLREGPAHGIHVLVWCDTLNNLNRTFDRQALREFEMRVLFQMSASDSSTLIDSPAASKLGRHRALFHSEEQARLEKFRPYGLPTPEWLDRVRQSLRGRSG